MMLEAYNASILESGAITAIICTALALAPSAWQALRLAGLHLQLLVARIDLACLKRFSPAHAFPTFCRVVGLRVRLHCASRPLASPYPWHERVTRWVWRHSELIFWPAYAVSSGHALLLLVQATLELHP